MYIIQILLQGERTLSLHYNDHTVGSAAYDRLIKKMTGVALVEETDEFGHKLAFLPVEIRGVVFSDSERDIGIMVDNAVTQARVQKEAGHKAIVAGYITPSNMPKFNA